VTTVAVIDHGAGNLVSMMRALETVGASPALVQSGPLGGFDRVVLPGVGATGPAMRTLNKTGLTGEIQDYEGPLLGVCVGMQLLLDYSQEDDTQCLGLIAGSVQQIAATRLPHIGWNSVSSSGNAILGGLDDDPLFYFVHSYVARPADATVVTGRTSYDDDVFASVIVSGLVTGVQFHPERSSLAGLRVLANFVGETTEVRNVA